MRAVPQGLRDSPRLHAHLHPAGRRGRQLGFNHSAPHGALPSDGPVLCPGAVQHSAGDDQPHSGGRAGQGCGEPQAVGAGAAHVQDGGGAARQDQLHRHLQGLGRRRGRCPDFPGVSPWLRRAAGLQGCDGEHGHPARGLAHRLPSHGLGQQRKRGLQGVCRPGLQDEEQQLAHHGRLHQLLRRGDLGEDPVGPPPRVGKEEQLGIRHGQPPYRGGRGPAGREGQPGLLVGQPPRPCGGLDRRHRAVPRAGRAEDRGGPRQRLGRQGQRGIAAGRGEDAAAAGCWRRAREVAAGHRGGAPEHLGEALDPDQGVGGSAHAHGPRPDSRQERSVAGDQRPGGAGGGAAPAAEALGALPQGVRDAPLTRFCCQPSCEERPSRC
mmetsp:Transcript_138363/g.430200  ORF Transcript_138363/g.430200 Transcript_138363/m.430200 type:complete len:380 (-) Transcript_138363:218-1357(-)